MNQRVFTQIFGVAAAVIEKEGMVMLVRENLPGDPDDGKWNHPAGWIEVGENPVDAVKKEAAEESGFEFFPEFFLGVYSLVRYDLEKFRGMPAHSIKLVFGGRIGAYDAKNMLGDTHGAKWFLPEEIYKMDASELRDTDIKQIVKDYFSGRRYSLEIIKHSVAR